ncbi:MAG TPA: metalloregulator ArsR/SmtB family transcription factor [Rhodothermales bacterium]|nr:metalloregulator ArsR/SmtB family transcription factor [Rhodothermales bacterium]
MTETLALPLTDDVLVARAKALAHPARVALLRTLAARGTCMCGQLVDALPLAQATVSQHLKVLREAGLIKGETDGPRSCYCLDAAALDATRAAFDGLFASLEGSVCTCADGCTCGQGGSCC